MKFIGSAPVTNGGTNPNPLSSPGSVPDANVVAKYGHGAANEDAPTNALVLSFQADGGSGTTTVSVWALDDATASLAVASRQYHLVQSGIVVTHGTLVAVTGPTPRSGPFYIQQTAGVAAGSVKVATRHL
jgi:hypothetical protein